MNKKQMMVLTTTRSKAKAGNAEAQLRMGRLYARGEIVEADPVNAYVWLSRAAAQHAGTADKELGAITATLTPADLARAKQILAGPLT